MEIIEVMPFAPFFILSSILWGLLLFVEPLTLKNEKWIKLSNLLFLLGLSSIGFYIIHIWYVRGIPPLQTLGETRLWYAFITPLCSYFLVKSCGRWILYYSAGLSYVFLSLNYYRPELFLKSLPPALKSIWFIPHVIVYMISYALLAVTALYAYRGLLQKHKGQKTSKLLLLKIEKIFNWAYVFLTLGLIFGAFWAKEAWGHYWTWDPKETWALITWLSCLIFIHLRWRYSSKETLAMIYLGINFIFLLICWFGVNYLPSAQQSVHTYGS